MLLGSVLFIIYTGLISFLLRALKYLLISPTYIYLFFNLIIVVLSVPYYFFYDEKFSIARVDEVSTPQFWGVINMYLIANIAFLIGFLIYHQVATSPIKKIYNLDLNDKLFSKYIIPDYFKKLAYALSLIVIVCYLSTYGTLLLDRENYIPVFENKFLITIAKIMSLVASIVLGLLYSKEKTTSILLISLIIAFTFGTGSRITFLLLILYFLTIFQMSGNTKSNKRRFVVQIIISFLFLSFLISLRKLDDHGIYPYIASVFSGESNILESIAFNVYYSFVFGVFATAKTLTLASPNWYYIYVSLNPLPGSMVGWPEVAKDLLITRFMPYTLHGQVFKMGYTFSITFFMVIGLVFGYFEKVIRKNLINHKKRTAVLFTLILSLFVFYSFEYHLRSASRYIYYAYFITLVIWSIKGVKHAIFKK